MSEQRLIGMCCARNEDHEIGMSARVALQYCDALVVLNHASTDNTGKILADLQEEVGDRLRILEATEDTWNEMPHRQMMLEAAREMGGTHMAIIDADEIVSGNIVEKIKDYVFALRPNEIGYLPGYNLRGSLNWYHANGVWGNREFSFAFVDNPRYGWNGDRFHHREPMGVSFIPRMMVAHGAGGILHLWGANERRLKAKHYLYSLTERLRWPAKTIEEINRDYGQHCYGRPWMEDHPRDWRYNAVPDEWWEGYAPLMPYLNVNKEPWQEQKCRDMIAAHPGLEIGLDTFGVIL